jgi:2-oxoglutarate ferredoxin oxidoreductase subunit alpha
MIEEVERAVHGKCPVHFKGLVNGELFKPAEIIAAVKEVA